MNERRNIAIVLLITGFLATLILLVSPSSPAPSVTLPSGAKITLHTVTYGKTHRLVYGSLLQRCLLFLPKSWMPQSRRAHEIKLARGDDTAIAWLVWKGTPAMMSSVPTYVIVNDQDERVMLLESAGWTSIDGQTVIDTRPLILPSRSKNLRLELYQLDTNSHSVRVAEFRFPNPGIKEPLAWTAETLPIRRVAGDVEFTLTEFAAERTVRRERGFATALNSLAFEVREGGRLTTNWQLRTIQASDAMGNRNEYGVFSHSDLKGKERWEGTWLLWPDVSAWKLRLHFTRRGGFGPDELWQVYGIPVPGSVGFTPVRFQTNLQGVALTVRGISNDHGFLPDGRMSVNATSNVLDLTWSPASPDVQVSLVGATDNRGRKLRVTGSAYYNGALGCKLDLATNTLSVDALFSVRRSRAIELLAKPAISP